MKTLYLECNMGAAGDMLMAALLELHPDPEAFLHAMNHLGLPGVEITAEKKETCGILGTHMHVRIHGQEEDAHVHTHDHDHDHTHAHHHHASLADISHMISHLPLPDPVKTQAQTVYQSIAEAESRAHGKPVTQVHFHEVGTLDAVADVVGVCLLLHELGAEDIVASPVHVGCGHVHCAMAFFRCRRPPRPPCWRGSPPMAERWKGNCVPPPGRRSCGILCGPSAPCPP